PRRTGALQASAEEGVAPTRLLDPPTDPPQPPSPGTAHSRLCGSAGKQHFADSAPCRPNAPGALRLRAARTKPPRTPPWAC
ncbi:hypothetical protein P7K49_024588, partial [Saguinus oedipus]